MEVIEPIPKINHPTLAQHYRPISILPFLSKVLESIVFDQLTEYLRENDFLDPCQFACRRNSSMQACIIRMVDDIRLAADRRKVTIFSSTSPRFSIECSMESFSKS